MLEYVVEIGYKKFDFKDKNDAVIFAEIAKLHNEDRDVSVSILLNWSEPEVKYVDE